jgi:hypothetical protein
MSDSAIKSTESHNLDPHARSELVRSARRHVRNGGTAAEFAKEHGLPRTTVIGWCKDNDGPRGRPPKLASFNETKILKLLSEVQRAHDWRSVQKLVRQQSGEQAGRRSIFRLLKKWRLGLEPASPNEIRTITAHEWIQPMETVDQGHEPLRLIIWRLLSRRGMECFMSSSGESRADAEKIGAAMVEKIRGRNRRIQTNHPELAQVLRDKLQGWEVTTFEDRFSKD